MPSNSPEYMRKYYNENKERHKENVKAEWYCEKCNKSYKGHKARHNKTNHPIPEQ